MKYRQGVPAAVIKRRQEEVGKLTAEDLQREIEEKKLRKEKDRLQKKQFEARTNGAPLTEKEEKRLIELQGMFGKGGKLTKSGKEEVENKTWKSLERNGQYVVEYSGPMFDKNGKPVQGAQGQPKGSGVVQAAKAVTQKGGSLSVSDKTQSKEQPAPTETAGLDPSTIPVPKEAKILDEIVPDIVWRLLKNGSQKPLKVTEKDVAEVENFLLNSKINGNYHYKFKVYGLALGYAYPDMGFTGFREKYNAIIKKIRPDGIKNTVVAKQFRDQFEFGCTLAKRWLAKAKTQAVEKPKESKSVIQDAKSVKDEQQKAPQTQQSQKPQASSSPVQAAKNLPATSDPNFKKEFVKKYPWVDITDLNDDAIRVFSSKLDKEPWLATVSYINDPGDIYESRGEWERDRKAYELRSKAGGQQGGKVEGTFVGGKPVQVTVEKSARKRGIEKFQENVAKLKGSNVAQTAGQVNADKKQKQPSALLTGEQMALLESKRNQIDSMRGRQGVPAAVIKRRQEEVDKLTAEDLQKEIEEKKLRKEKERLEKKRFEARTNGAPLTEKEEERLAALQGMFGKGGKLTKSGKEEVENRTWKSLERNGQYVVEYSGPMFDKDGKPIHNKDGNQTQKDSNGSVAEEAKAVQQEQYGEKEAEADKARIQELLAKRFRGNEHLETKRRLDAAQADLDKFNASGEGKELEKLFENRDFDKDEKMKKLLKRRQQREAREKEFEELSAKDARFKELNEKQNKSEDELLELQNLATTREEDKKKLGIHQFNKKAKEDEENRYQELVEKEKEGKISKEERDELLKMDVKRQAEAKDLEDEKNLDAWEKEYLRFRELRNKQQIKENKLETAKRMHGDENCLTDEEKEELKKLQDRREAYLDKQALPSTATDKSAFNAALDISREGKFASEHEGSGVEGSHSVVKNVLDQRSEKYKGFDAHHEELSPEEEGATFGGKLLMSTQLGDRQTATVRESGMTVGGKGSFNVLDTNAQIQSQGFSDLRGSMEDIGEYQQQMSKLIQENHGMLPVSVLEIRRIPAFDH